MDAVDGLLIWLFICGLVGFVAGATFMYIKMKEQYDRQMREMLDDTRPTTPEP